MKYSKKPKYRLDKKRLNIPKEEIATPEDIYKQMLIDKIRKRKRC